jgi:cyanophycinase
VIVDQHFVARKREKRLAGVIADHPNYVGIGIDESTAIVCRGKDIEVVGKSTATVLLATGDDKAEVIQVAKPGAHLDLIELRNAAIKRAAKAKP